MKTKYLLLRYSVYVHEVGFDISALHLVQVEVDQDQYANDFVENLNCFIEDSTGLISITEVTEQNELETLIKHVFVFDATNYYEDC